MKKKIISYGFIDANNLILGLKKLGIKLDYFQFFRFLKDKYRIDKAFWIVGYRKEFESIYKNLKKAGFTLLFKKTSKGKGIVKGNVDILLAVQSFRSLHHFDRFVLVSGDGDFLDLIYFMREQGKEVKICVPNKKTFSQLFKSFEGQCVYLENIEKIQKKR